MWLEFFYFMNRSHTSEEFIPSAVSRPLAFTFLKIIERVTVFFVPCNIQTSISF